jgi:hypothetical protein
MAVPINHRANAALSLVKRLWLQNAVSKSRSYIRNAFWYRGPAIGAPLPPDSDPTKNPPDPT